MIQNPKNHSSERHNMSFIAFLLKRGIKTIKDDGLNALIIKVFNKIFPSISKTIIFTKWYKINEPNSVKLEAQKKECAVFLVKPLISIVIPVFNPPLQILSETIDSVLAQTYPNWELCIVNADSKNTEIGFYLQKLHQSEPRIKVKSLELNLGIAENTNEAILMASGDYIAFLDHDDLLAPFALYEVVTAIESNRDVDIFYSDEDKITKNSAIRFSPYFKPGYSIDLLRAMNYMTHFLVIRKDIGDKVGWLSRDFDGSQDHDFILKVVEQVQNIFHIEKILYHWRAIPGSTAIDKQAKLYASEAGINAVKQHLQRQGINADVKNAEIPHTYQITYSHESYPLVSIIVPTQDQSQTLRNCINSILTKTTYENYEVILIENNSKEEETFRTYREFSSNPKIRIISWKKTPFNFSVINDFGVKHANGELFLFLNNDIEIINSDWLEILVGNALREKVGIVGAKLYYPNQTIQHAGIVIGIGGIAGHAFLGFDRYSPGYFGLLKIPHNVSAVTGACMMMRKSVYKEVGGFDPKFVLAFGDVDICLKSLARGYLNVWTPFAEMYHHESLTRGLDDTLENKERFKKEFTYFKTKWSAEINNGDYYYNSNLSLVKADYSLKLKI